MAKRSQCEDTAKLRALVRFGNVSHLAQQLGIVVGVSGVALFFAGGVSGGMNAGRATKRIDLESGIVGEDVVRERLVKRLVLQPSGDFARLLRGVRGEAITVFNDRRGIRKSGQR